MNITSEKRYKLIPVTDLDIVYIGGIHDTITFGAHDLVTEDPVTITVLIRDLKTDRTLERLVCERRNILSFKYKDRILRVEDKTPLPIESANEPTGD